MTKLIANMIGRNEADRYLEPVLEALYPIVDQIVFTDDGSEDSTFMIAKDAGASVIRIEDPLFETDESILRTISWEHLSIIAEPGDWILSIDCDEKLYGAEKMREVLPTLTESVVMVKFCHMWNPTQFRVDKAWKPDWQPRLFRYHKEGNIMKRSLACGQYPTYVRQMVADGKSIDLGMRMQHLGYMRDEDKLSKFEKYMRIDGGKFHSLRHLESIIDEHPTLEDWDGELALMVWNNA